MGLFDFLLKKKGHQGVSETPSPSIEDDPLNDLLEDPFPPYSPSEVYHPPSETLPDGFVFPKQYLDWVSKDSIPSLDPYRLCCFLPKDVYEDFYSRLQEKYPYRIVPLAIYSEDEDFFYCCFLNEKNSEASVVYLNPYESRTQTECENMKGVPFSDWLDEAIRFSSDYQAGIRKYLEETEEEERDRGNRQT